MKGDIFIQIGLGGLIITTIMFLGYRLITINTIKKHTPLHRSSKFTNHYFTEKVTYFNKDLNKTEIL